jgi:hypothetical protein
MTMWGVAYLLAALSTPGAAASPLCDGTLAQSTGVLDIRLGEPFAAATARSTYRFHSNMPPTGYHDAGERLDLRLRDGDRLLDLPGIGGTYNTGLHINTNPGGTNIGTISFNYQNRPLTLAEALDRAVMLRRWFVAGGFRAQAIIPGQRDSRGFRVGNAPHNLAGPRDRAAAAAMLANERLPAMNLFTLRRGGQDVYVTLENWRRVLAATGQGGGDAFRACNGREWGLEVMLTTA